MVADGYDEFQQYEFADAEADAVLKTGSLTNMLAEAASLRVLKLRLWGQLEYKKPTLEDALGDIHFHHLYDLAISGCETDSQYLVDVVLRHKATLRRFSLSGVRLIGSIGWPEFFDAIAENCQTYGRSNSTTCSATPSV